MLSILGNYNGLAKWQKYITTIAVVFLVLPALMGQLSQVTFSPSNNPEVLNATDEEIVQPIQDETNGITIDTRGPRYTTVTEKEPNDNPKDSMLYSNAFVKDSLLVGSSTGQEIDYYFTTALSTWDYKTGVPNITLYPQSLAGFASTEDWIIVQLIQWMDFDSDSKVEDHEMIIMHQESWNQQHYSPVCWGHGSAQTTFFVRVEGRPKSTQTTLTYELKLDWSEVSPSANDTTYSIDTARGITKDLPILDQVVDMDNQPFDWFYMDPIKMPGMIGSNVSVQIRIVASSLNSIYSDGVPNGALFVLELRAVILHETTKGIMLFGGVGNGSRHDETISYPGMKKQIFHHDIVLPTQTTGDIKRSYIGVFAQTYGIDRNSRHVRYHDGDLLDKQEDTAMNGWIRYSFVWKNSEPVIRPVLSPVSVYSLRTQNEYGRTPDTFKYHIWYKSAANYEPIIFKLQILKDGELIRTEEILQADLANQNFRTPTEFLFKIEGEKLGEGCFQYQIVCFDKHTWALGSKDDHKKIYDGPCVVNNIPPQVRKTAQTYIEMKEDDRPIYLKLKDIFVDADDDQLNYNIVDTHGNFTTVWETHSLYLRIIVNKNRLRIEPRQDRFGKSTINLFATDNVDPPANATFQLIVTVAPVNDPPEIKDPFDKLYFFGEVRFDEDTVYSDLNLTDVFHDPVENDPLTYTISGNDNVDVNIFPNGSVQLIPKENWSGVEELRFTAMDPAGGSVFDDLKIRVQPVNDAPILNDTSPIIAYEDSWTNITFQAWDPADDDTLIFSTDVAIVVNLKEDEYIFDQFRGKLSLFPPNRVATGKTYKISVTVRDQPGEGAGKAISVTKYVNITIRNTWDKPVCRILEPQNGDKFLHFEPITFQGLVVDDDQKVPENNEKISYEWFSDVDGKLGNAEVVRNVPLTAGSRGQQHKITFRVSDGKFYSQTEIFIWILHPDDKKDTDADGMPDYWEDRNNLDKYNSADADYDSDTDDYTNHEEYFFGSDGLADNNDPTDPWDPEDHPGIIVIQQKEADVDYFLPLMILFIIVIIMIISIILTYVMISSRVRTAREYAERKRELETELKKQKQREEDDNFYGAYAPKDSDALCHVCGHRNKVKTMNRPLAVTCSQCSARGVIY
jgi:hypothetical protein